jgi:hypothetical protein
LRTDGVTKRPVSAWQSFLVLPALGSLGLGVVLPLWLLAVFLSTLASVAWFEDCIRRISAQHQQVMPMAALVSTVLLLGGFGAATWGRLRGAFRQPGAPEARGGSMRWLLRHPWWTLGLGLFVAHVLLWRNPSQHPLAAASVLVSACGWGSLRLGWRLSRASPLLSGLVVAAGLFTAVGWVLFLNVAEGLTWAVRELSQAVNFSRQGGGGGPPAPGP